MAKLPMPRPALPKAPPPKPVTAPKPHTIEQIELNDERRDKRTKSSSKVDIFYTEVARRYLGWSNAVISVGSAYKKADDKYKEILGKQTAKDALETQIFFSVLTVATSGALGWISYAAAKANGGVESALRDAVESSIQATAGEVFSANGPLLFPPSGDSTVSPDPQVFQNELQKKVNNVYRDVLRLFGEIKTRYSNLPLEAWDTYDPAREKAALEKWQKAADELADDDDLPDGDWMARELERGRWAKFVRENHSYRDFGIFQTADTPDDVGSVIRSRLEDLGVSQAATPTAHYGRFGTAGPGQLPTAKVWDWAQHYTVRSFIEEKKKPRGGGPDHQ
jgi:hypothetical protein